MSRLVEHDMASNDGDDAGFSFTRGIADNKNRLRLVGSDDDADSYYPTLLFTYDHGAREGDRWSFDDPGFNTAVCCITSYIARVGEGTLVAVTLGGDLASYHDLSIHEKINDMTLPRDRARYGQIEGIKQIGEHLYACGDNGQLYKRDTAEFGGGGHGRVWTKNFLI